MKYKFVISLLAIVILAFLIRYISLQKNVEVIDTYSFCIDKLMVLNADKAEVCQSVERVLANHAKRHGLSVSEFVDEAASSRVSDHDEKDSYEYDYALHIVLIDAAVPAACEYEGIIYSIKDYSILRTHHWGVVYDEDGQYFDCTKVDKLGLTDISYLDVENQIDHDYDYEIMYDSPEGILLDKFNQAVVKNDLKLLYQLIPQILNQPAIYKRYIRYQLPWKNISIKALRLLVDEDVIDIVYRHDYYQQPLVDALRNQRFDIADWLIDKGAPLDLHDDKGNTLITIAAGVGHIELIKRLLITGADINGVRGSEHHLHLTPIQAAAEKGHLDVINYLYAHGATLPDTDWTGIWGQPVMTSSLYYAVKGGNLAIVNKFISWRSFKDDGQDLIIRAIETIAKDKGDFAILKTLYQSGFKHKSSYPLTALFYYVISDHPVKYKDTVLFNANGLLDVLVGNGFDLNNYKYNNIQQNVLLKLLNGWSYHHYFSDNNPQSIRFGQWLKSFLHNGTSRFIEKGVEVNAVDNHNQTPISIAAANCYPEIVEKLINAGADISIKDKNNKSPRDKTMRVLKWNKKNKSNIKSIFYQKCNETIKLLDYYKL